MTKTIETFYVLDFDRCLGNVDANFNLIKDIANELSIVDNEIFQLARDRAEQNEISFSVFDYLKEHSPSVDLDLIESLYIERARFLKDGLLEPGADEFIKFLRETDRDFCIMSYGEERWQKLKIAAAGLASVPTTIVSSKQKGRYISQWSNEADHHFYMPEDFSVNGDSIESREVVLVDDKINAFEELPDGARGYLVNKLGTTALNNFEKIPSSVRLVDRIDAIITQESLPKTLL